MDKGLRITVGNEVYFEKSAPRMDPSVRENSRSTLHPRMEQFSRMRGDMRSGFPERQLLPARRGEEHGVWLPPDDRQPRWSPGRGPSGRLRSPHDRFPPAENKRYSRGLSPPIDRRPDMSRWSPLKDNRPTFDLDLNRRPIERPHSPGMDHRRSPHRRSSPGRIYARSPHRGPSPGRRLSRSPRRIPSPTRRLSRSPRRIPSPGRRLSRSPRRIPSPGRRYSRSPHHQSSGHRYSRSPPRHRQGYSPDVRRGRSPHRKLNHHSPGTAYQAKRRSPYSRHSHSPGVEKNRSPFHKHGPFSSRPTERRYSSSESSGSRNGSIGRRRMSQGRSTSANKSRPGNDLLHLMHSKHEEDSGSEKASSYLHPALDRNRQRKEELPREQFKKEDSSVYAYINPEVAGDGHSLQSLSKAYCDESPLSNRYAKTDAVDDEDSYLYGEGTVSSQQSNKRYDPMESNYNRTPAEKLQQEDTQNSSSSVTPGGFDTKALKNVLKAIGFDFELSAQSLQKATTNEAKVSPAVSTTKTSSLSATLSNLTSAQKSVFSQAPNIHALPKPVYQQQQTVQQPVAMPGSLFPSTSVPSNQPGLFLYPPPTGIYPPASIAGVSQQIVYQPGMLSNPYMPLVQPAAVSQQNQVTETNRPNLKVVPTVSISNDTAYSKGKTVKSVTEERKARKKRLDYLETELDNLKKKQKELVRKKQQQLNRGDQELMRQNSLLQAGVEKQIKEIRIAAERAAQIESSSEESDSDGSSSSDIDERNYDYIDSGNHFCRDCNVTTANLMDFLNHLHTKSHKKLMDQTKKPWYKKPSSKKKSKHAVISQLKGPQFLLPIHAYYCQLCKSYSGDAVAAEEHCKTLEHNQKYVKYCKKNPEYEKLLQSSGIQSVAERLKKLKQEYKVDSYSTERKPQQFGRNETKVKQNKEDLIGDQDFKSSQNGTPRNYSPHRDQDKVFGPRQPSSKYRELSPKPHIRSSSKYKMSPQESQVRRSSSSRKRSASPAKRRSVSPRKEQEVPRKVKRAFEERPDHRREKEDRRNISKRRSRWSPGYDALEKSREKQEEREALKPKPTSSGTSFGKFTWKRTEKSKPEKGEPDTPPSGSGQKKLSLKLSGKPTSNVLARPARNKSGLSDRVGNFAPHTTIKPKIKQPGPPPGKPPGFIAKSKTYKPPAPKQSPIPTFVSNKTEQAKPIASLLSTNSTSAEKKDSAPAKITPKLQISNPKEIPIEKQEPPPPGTEDIFENDSVSNHSDASGISMEIGSDADD